MEQNITGEIKLKKGKKCTEYNKEKHPESGNWFIYEVKLYSAFST